MFVTKTPYLESGLTISTQWHCSISSSGAELYQVIKNIQRHPELRNWATMKKLRIL